MGTAAVAAAAVEEAEGPHLAPGCLLDPTMTDATIAVIADITHEIAHVAADAGNYYDWSAPKSLSSQFKLLNEIGLESLQTWLISFIAIPK